TGSRWVSPRTRAQGRPNRDTTPGAGHARLPERTLGSHPDELAAGDVEHLAVHVVGPRRAQEEDPARCLLRRAGAPERDQHRGHLAHLLGNAELDLLAADLHRV